jgi:predicted MFS family arabinose efflux permease
MWLSKTLYESLPYYYMVVGLAALGGGLYVGRWYWAEILMTAGIASLTGGLVVWLKRRDYRRSRSRRDIQDRV